MGFCRLETATSGCEMSRDTRASTWSGCARKASSAAPSGACSGSDRHSRLICRVSTSLVSHFDRAR